MYGPASPQPGPEHRLTPAVPCALGSGLFPTLNVIAVATIATGSIAGMLTVAMAYITDLDPENVSKNLGLVGVALGFAFISGPVRVAPLCT